MKILAAYAALMVPATLLSSCSSVPDQMAGTYLPKTPRLMGGEWITIEKGGAMTWHYSSKNPNEQHIVGFVSTRGGRPETASLSFAATSPFIGTKLGFSPDCSKLTVHWDQRFDRSPRPISRSTEFVRKQAAP